VTGLPPELRPVIVTRQEPSLGLHGPRLAGRLTEAELRVVRYLPSNLKASEIAAELYVSANT
jgi:DNA-binding NarL/FixJ family response regulator